MLNMSGKLHNIRGRVSGCQKQSAAVYVCIDWSIPIKYYLSLFINYLLKL